MSESSIKGRWNSWSPYFLSTVRIVAAFLFVQHGTEKLFAYPASALPGGGTMSISSMPGVGGILEAAGGTLLLLGLCTRPVAFLLSGEMAVAYFTKHMPLGFWPTLNHGEPAVLYCFLWLYMSAAGPGPWSVDALLGRGRGAGQSGR